jgi:hypothetical protein
VGVAALLDRGLTITRMGDDGPVIPRRVIVTEGRMHSELVDPPAAACEDLLLGGQPEIGDNLVAERPRPVRRDHTSATTHRCRQPHRFPRRKFLLPVAGWDSLTSEPG